MASGFIDQLVDWRDFEEFVRDLYAKDPSLEVEHNVTQIGKSGAQRQIDVKFTHNAGGHTYVTLVECKRWKEKIDRRRIDELFASIEDLNAAKGVMFTTAGYEVGAETYAEHKGIDLFVVRDLTDEEWGPPGRVVWFYWHLYTAEISNVDPGRADPNRLPRLFANLPRFRRAEEDLAGFRRALNESRRSLANGGWPDFECEVVATVARHAAILGSYCIGKPAFGREAPFHVVGRTLGYNRAAVESLARSATAWRLHQPGPHTEPAAMRSWLGQVSRLLEDLEGVINDYTAVLPEAA